MFQPLDWSHLTTYRAEVGPRALDELPAFAAVHQRIWLVESHAADRASQASLASPVKSILARLGYRPATWLAPKIQLVLFERSGQPA